MISECVRIEVSPPLQTKINIEELIKTDVPIMQGSAARITGLLNDINVSTRKLTEAISYDPVLTARILRLANSPVYSLQKNVSTLNQAIDVVGIRAVYDILILGLATDSFSKEIRDSEKGKKIWEHSLAVALLARELGQMLGLRGIEEAFICGLLHDIGKILLLKHDSVQYNEILEIDEESKMLQVENATFGYTHAQVGSFIANRWALPDNVCYTILNHHDPSQSEQFAMVAHLVSIADAIANVNGFGLRKVDGEFLGETDSAIILHLTPEKMSAAWEKTSQSISEINRTFA